MKEETQIAEGTRVIVTADSPEGRFSKGDVGIVEDNNWTAGEMLCCVNFTQSENKGAGDWIWYVNSKDLEIDKQFIIENLNPEEGVYLPYCRCWQFRFWAYALQFVSELPEGVKYDDVLVEEDGSINIYLK